MAFSEVPQPVDREERTELARKALQELRLDVELWVDEQGDRSRAMFGDLPHSAIVIDPDGRVRLKLSWCDPEVLRRTIPEISAASTEERRLQRARAEAVMLEQLERQPGAAGDAAARHARDSLLAGLVVSRPDDARRAAWLSELASHGPEQQRAWSRRMAQEPKSRELR